MSTATRSRWTPESVCHAPPVPLEAATSRTDVAPGSTTPSHATDAARCGTQGSMDGEQMSDSHGASSDSADRDEPVDDTLDTDDWPLEEDPELSGIEFSLEEGLIYDESESRWMVWEEADEYFGPEVASEWLRINSPSSANI